MAVGAAPINGGGGGAGAGGRLLVLVADHDYVGGDRPWLEAVAEVAAAIAAAGCRDSILLQLRARRLDGARRRSLMAEGLNRAASAGVPVLLNGTEAEARDMGFGGVHWPEDRIPAGAAPPTGEARDVTSMTTAAGFLRSAAVHSRAALDRAVAAGAHLALFGPVFAPGSKDAAAAGLDALAVLAAASPIPIVAIGGVDASRVPACLQAGARGVAVISAVFAPGAQTASRIADLRRRLAQ